MSFLIVTKSCAAIGRLHRTLGRLSSRAYTSGKKSVESRPNTDGTDTISTNLLDQVTEELGLRGRRILAVQVRLGPAKGMLIRSDREHDTVQLFKEMVNFC